MNTLTMISVVVGAVGLVVGVVQLMLAVIQIHKSRKNRR